MPQGTVPLGNVLMSLKAINLQLALSTNILQGCYFLCVCFVLFSIKILLWCEDKMVGYFEDLNLYSYNLSIVADTPILKIHECLYIVPFSCTGIGYSRFIYWIIHTTKHKDYIPFYILRSRLWKNKNIFPFSKSQ